MTAIFFCCGLALGVILGACLWSGAQYVAKKLYDIERRKQLAAQRQEIIGQQKRIADAKAKLRMEFGDEMTKEQERIMEQELSTVFREFQNPGVPKQQG